MTSTDQHANVEDATRAELLAQVVALQGKLESLPAIEQAKGALMAAYGLTADQAFDLLRFHSQHGNVKIRAIADHLTALLSTSSTRTDAITRFDQLLTDVTSHLHRTSNPLPKAAELQGEAAEPARITAIPAEELPQLTARAVATASPGITIADNSPDQPLVYANHAFSVLTGYPLGDVLGRNCRFLQGADIDHQETAILSRAMRTGREASAVLRNYRSDGSLFWNEVSISPIRNPSNQITHFIGTQTDVTERVNADAIR